MLNPTLKSYLLVLQTFVKSKNVEYFTMSVMNAGRSLFSELSLLREDFVWRTPNLVKASAGSSLRFSSSYRHSSELKCFAFENSKRNLPQNFYMNET